MKELQATEEKCDFCSSQPSPWTYPASYGTAWGACEDCYKLIEAGDRVGLVERSVDYAPALAGMSREMRREARHLLRVKIKELHDDIFWRYCTKPPTYESMAFDGETQRSKQ